MELCGINIFLISAVIFSVGGANGNNAQNEPLDIGDIPTLRRNISRPEDIQAIADWKEQCRETAGQEALDNMERARRDLAPCITEIIKMDKLMHEIKISSPRGELDVVFKKYCKKRADLMKCIENLFSSVEVCMNEKQQQDLNVTRRAIDAGIDFICHKEGDHIALFMAEKGKECVEQHRENISMCVEERVPDIKNFTQNPNSMDVASFAINEESCKKLNAMHGCVVKYTEKCDDPTPSNILDSLITQMLKVTPCLQTSSAPSAGVLHLLPHLLTLTAAALMAANILL